MRSMMSRQAMEQALGKLVIDVGFREAFFRDPIAASMAAGIHLTDQERSALGRLSETTFERLLGGEDRETLE